METMVGRAELKLAEAVRAFDYDFRGKTVLDIGSSTGGFTEYALRHGAVKVIAIEKGTQQMKAPLRYDECIDLHEKTDFLQIKPDSQLARILQVDTVLADVSFVSLTKILAQAQRIISQQNNFSKYKNSSHDLKTSKYGKTSKQVDYLVMLKPQFEARSEQLNRGVVKNEKMRREIIQNFERWLMRNGFVILKKRDNATVGKVGGNRERFYWLRAARPTTQSPKKLRH